MRRKEILIRESRMPVHFPVYTNSTPSSPLDWPLGLVLPCRLLPDVQALSAVRLPFEQSRSFAFCAFCAACWAFSSSEHITSATAARSRPLLLTRLLAFALLCSVLGSCHLCSARTFWKYLVARSHPACSLPQCKVPPRKSCETHAFHAAL